ncbi:glycosyltransferase family 4 protein [Anaerovibrio slackiae]|uniref:glycosyltransferase family 4 protein n=1 Tax=Anaerovibrio slackiae TaxID=2652309 RepID=UPI003870C6DC
MNILLINHYAGSDKYGMEYRPYYMAREWVKLGHNVTIVGANFSHLRNKQPTCREEIVDGIRYVWLPTNSYKGNGIGRIVNMGLFVLQLFFRPKAILAGFIPDVVIASSTKPLEIYPEKLIADRYKAKLVYEVHDIWPLSPMEIGNMSARHPFIRVMQAAEDYACRHVDKIISLLPRAEEHYLEHGLAKGKFFCVPNGVVISEHKSKVQAASESSEECLRQMDNWRRDNYRIVIFAGSHGKANALDVLLSAAKYVQLRTKIVLLGDGPEKASLKEKAEIAGLKNVVFFPRVPKQEVPLYLEKADVAYIGLVSTSLFRFGISPNKIMDYMLAKKAIIQSIDAGNDIVCESGCGISVPAGDGKKVAEAIDKMAAMPLEKLAELGKNGYRYVTKNHDYRVLAEKFISYIS